MTASVYLFRTAGAHARKLDLQPHGQVRGRGEAIPVPGQLEAGHQDRRNHRRSYPQDPNAQVSLEGSDWVGRTKVGF